MKKIATLLLVAMLFVMVLSIASCGCSATRYTITEKEWKTIESKIENCTVKSETYYGDEVQRLVIKQADGMVCYCESEPNDKDSNADTSSQGQAITGSNSTIDTPTSSTIGSSKARTVESSVNSFDNEYVDSTVAGSFIGPADMPPDYTPPSNLFSGEVSFSHTIGSLITIFTNSINSSVDLKPFDPYVNLDMFADYTYVGTYFDEAGNKYVNIDMFSFISSQRCYVEYEGESYVEIQVLDDDGKTVTKWTENRMPPPENIKMSDFVKYEDLVYDEKEKAYSCEYETAGIKRKDIMYFENGMPKKIISFLENYTDESKSGFDLSDLTPSDVKASEDYISCVVTYSNYGTTKVDHKFVAKDVIKREEK
ncbi:MAG: hypothetical protein J6B45_04550 [Clostridia bacterium]|nr:hypothetical protein [Clostridia bacterium]